MIFLSEVEMIKQELGFSSEDFSLTMGKIPNDYRIQKKKRKKK